MKLHSFKISAFVIFLLVLSGASYYILETSTPEQETVEWYGYPLKISMSGDFRFISSDDTGVQGEEWFWAVPENPDDLVLIESVFSTLSEYPQNLYKIIGIPDEEDCGYYENADQAEDMCIKTVLIQSVQIVNTPM